VILANAATAIVRQSLISLVNKVARVRIPRPLESQAASGAIASKPINERYHHGWAGSVSFDLVAPTAQLII
jgi:hypothetical protein